MWNNYLVSRTVGKLLGRTELKLETENRKPKIRNQKLETQNRKTKIRNRKSETKNRKPKIGKQKSENEIGTEISTSKDSG